MNKKEFIQRASMETGLTQKQLSESLSALVDAITIVLAEGEEVNIPGLCKFSTKVYDAHTARNPATGDTIEVPPTRRVKCTFSSTLKNAVASVV